MKERLVVLLTTSPDLRPSTRAHATRLAQAHNATLLFLHVVPLSPAEGEGMLHDAVQLSSPRHPGWLARQRPTSPAVPFRHLLRVGDPEALAAEADAALEIELMVVEEARHSWLGAPLRRSLGERLVHRLRCPVVLVGPAVQPRERPLPSAPPLPTGLTHVMTLLNALVDARVEALRRCMDQAAEAVAQVAGLRVVRDVLEVSRRRALPPRSVAHLAVTLDEHMRALRAVDWILLGPRDRWSHRALPPGAEGAERGLLRQLDRRTPCVSLPVALAGERLVQLAGARVPGVEGGRLVFVFDAADDFLRILGQPGPLPSLETYAFDSGGLMLSNSRFPHHLLAAGLLPTAGAQTALRLRVAEPSDGPREAWPLTQMAAHAVRHQDGWDPRGYLDYRGTAVVGAWRWVAEHGFGVTAEVDQAVVRGARAG